MEDRLRWAALVTAVAPVCWGAQYWVTATYLPADAPLWGATWRALPAGLLLLLVARRLPRGAWWWRSLLLGVLNFTGFYALVYVAAQLLPSSIASSLMALAPVVLTLLAWPLLAQRPTARLLACAGVGVAGVLLVVQFAAGGLDPRGIAASLAALALSSLGAILTTRWRDEQPLVATTAWQLLGGGLVALALAVGLEGPPPAADGPALAAYAGIAVVGTAVACLCWFHGLRHLPAGTVGLVGLLNPVTGIVLGVWLAGELLTPWQALGIALVFAAIAAGRRRAPRPVPAPVAVPTGAPEEVTAAR